MAAGGVLRVFSVISGILGTVQFGIDNFASPDSSGSTIRILAGLDVDGGLQNACGDLPDVRLYNEAGNFLGISADTGKIDDGTTGEIKIKHKEDKGQQAAYALFSANNNAIYIASASITWPNGDEYGWVGDWGRECGGSWYFSNVFIQGSNHKPTFLWIDGNGEQPQTGFQIHWPGIVYWALDNGSRETFAADESIRSRIHERRQNRHNPTDNSTVISLADRLAELLVFDSEEEHSATELCLSKTSLGPDFANNDQKLFCHMSDKTLWPFCNDVYPDDCFDADLQQLVIGGKVVRDRKYANVINWGGSSKSASGAA
ncbi:hypothetical protein QBC38DRAFT_501330 [Podospora fimiseda]|uniref:Uncharacterized protein n=1 Tax=Podospora fimiseda TaxID=252190 RepID=A0AAN7BLE1_9PEZI|nr:hypothetical protein QBC38DRAFT_501330 [Podospora fimiseda]